MSSRARAHRFNVFPGEIGAAACRPAPPPAGRRRSHACVPARPSDLGLTGGIQSAPVYTGQPEQPRAVLQ
jgi:hypothetical protein